MNRHNWIGVLLFGGLFIESFFLQGNAALYVNGPALLIVTCGTLGALFLCYPASDLYAAVRVALNLYRHPPPSSNEVVSTMMEMALQSRNHGLLALESMGEQSTISFLKRALGLLVDRMREDELVEILNAEMLHFRQRRALIERTFRQAALFAPAFGVAGSVVGLIDMLASVDDPGVVLRTIPLALTSPLYGVLLANAVFFPIAEGIHSKTQKELLIQKLITDGVLVIQRETNPRRLAIKLESFLTPSARTLGSLSMSEIRERLQQFQSEPTAEAPWTSAEPSRPRPRT